MNTIFCYAVMSITGFHQLYILETKTFFLSVMYHLKRREVESVLVHVGDWQPAVCHGRATMLSSGLRFHPAAKERFLVSFPASCLDPELCDSLVTAVKS